jgi:hypothetical protein
MVGFFDLNWKYGAFSNDHLYGNLVNTCFNFRASRFDFPGIMIVDRALMALGAMVFLISIFSLIGKSKLLI